MTNQSKLKFIEFLSETKSTALPYKNGVYTLTSVANIKNIKAKLF